MPLEPALEAFGVTKRFGDRVAVDNVSLSLHAGEVVALLGPNGAGKTTLLRVLAGLMQPTRGAVAFEGRPVHTAASAARRRLGFLTEVPGLWNRLTVEANLLTFAKLYGLEEPRRRVMHMLHQVGLADRAAQRAEALSKGMQQKLALARALLHEPAVMLLDEPTAGLDPEMTRHVRALVDRLRAAGTAVLISTHDLHEAERVADRVAILNTSLLAADTPSALRHRAGRSRVEIRLSAPAHTFRDVLRRSPAREVHIQDRLITCAVDAPESDVPTLVAALVAEGAGVCSVTPAAVSLEEAYLAALAPAGPVARM